MKLVSGYSLKSSQGFQVPGKSLSNSEGKENNHSEVVCFCPSSGSGVSQQQQRCKSTSLPGEEQPQSDMEDSMFTDPTFNAGGGAPPPCNGITTESSIWAELENLDQR